jgi:hypothetical protein
LLTRGNPAENGLAKGPVVMKKMTILDLQQPRPGYWYIDRTGKLIKVKMVRHGLAGIEAVLIQYVEETTHSISIDDWQCLDFVVPRYRQGNVILESDNVF